MREAPSIVIINKLLEMKAVVSAYDPEAMDNARYHFGDKIDYVDNEYDALTGSDALLILTEWNEFRNPDFNKVKASMKEHVIFDGRNLFNRNHTKKYGFVHYSIGKAAVKP
jgi:UDPglucose 6-dehydrogenase